MSLIKMAESQSDREGNGFKDPELVDTAIASAVIGAPSSLAFGGARAYTEKVFDPKNFNRKKALKRVGRTVGIGTSLSMAATPLRNAVGSFHNTVGDKVLDQDYSKARTQTEHDLMRENSTTTGAAVTSGLAGSLVGGPIGGALASGLVGTQTYLGEKAESAARRGRENILNRFKKE